MRSPARRPPHRMGDHDDPRATHGLVIFLGAFAKGLVRMPCRMRSVACASPAARTASQGRSHEAAVVEAICSIELEEQLVELRRSRSSPCWLAPVRTYRHHVSPHRLLVVAAPNCCPHRAGLPPSAATSPPKRYPTRGGPSGAPQLVAPRTRLPGHPSRRRGCTSQSRPSASSPNTSSSGARRWSPSGREVSRRARMDAPRSDEDRDRAEASRDLAAAGAPPVRTRPSRNPPTRRAVRATRRASRLVEHGGHEQVAAQQVLTVEGRHDGSCGNSSTTPASPAALAHAPARRLSQT